MILSEIACNISELKSSYLYKTNTLTKSFFIMKRIALYTVLFATLTLTSCYFGDWNNGVRGEGNVTTEVVSVDDFTGVHASSGIDVTISQGDYYVEVVADENLHEYITVEREGRMLKIGSERNIYRAESKVVHVTLPELTEIKISSAGDVEAKTDFECEELDISISSAGDLELGVTADEIDLSISSSGDCNLWGRTGRFDAQLSSAGDLNAYDLEADYVSVRVSSAGDARVYASKEIEMSASSAGNIYYKGDAHVKRSSTSSAGSIIRK